MGRAGSLLVSLLITAAVGFIYFHHNHGGEENQHRQAAFFDKLEPVLQLFFRSAYDRIIGQGRPVRVAPIAYADLIKWFTNRGNGLPAYVVVDMVTHGSRPSGPGWS